MTAEGGKNKDMDYLGDGDLSASMEEDLNYFDDDQGDDDYIAERSPHEHDDEAGMTRDRKDDGEYSKNFNK